MATVAELMGRMNDLGTSVPNKTLTLQLFGKPGVGKTVQAVTLAKVIAGSKKVLYIDTREGWVSLQNHPKLLPGVTRIEMKKFEDLGLIVQALAGGQLTDVGAVVFDEASTAADMLLNELQHIALAKPDNEIITEKPDWTLYRSVGDSLVQVITAFQQMKIHFIMLAHEKQKEINGFQMAMPGYSDTINDKMQRLLHVSARQSSQIESQGPQGTVYKRVIQSHPSVAVAAKSRIGGLPVSADLWPWTQQIAAWLSDSAAPLVPEATTLRNDPVPAEVAHVTTPDSEPVMGEM